jgi:hypothetical protein
MKIPLSGSPRPEGEGLGVRAFSRQGQTRLFKPPSDVQWNRPVKECNVVVSKPLFGFDVDNEVRTVEAMASRLKPYVYEDELYGLMPGKLPRLTIGGLLMRLHRLYALNDTFNMHQKSAVEDARKKLNDVRNEWRVAYEKKVLRELGSRFGTLEQFLAECAENPRTCGENYPSSIEKRTIIELLLDEAEALGIMTDDLKNRKIVVDNKLHRYTQNSNFTWDSRLESAYPPDKFWYLYSKVTQAAS